MIGRIFAEQPKGQRIDRHATRMVMTGPNRDRTGVVWPAGTEYEPGSHGTRGYTVTIVSGHPLPSDDLSTLETSDAEAQS